MSNKDRSPKTAGASPPAGGPLGASPRNPETKGASPGSVPAAQLPAPNNPAPLIPPAQGSAPQGGGDAGS